MQALFKILGEPHRYAMVRLLLRGPRHVQAVADALDIPQPAVSRHARILADAGFLILEREGRFTRMRCPPPACAREVAGLLELVSAAEGLGPIQRGGEPARGAPGTDPAGQPSATRGSTPAGEDLEDYLL